jgi:hypothetical protein
MAYNIKGDISVLRRIFGKYLNLSSLSGSTSNKVLTTDIEGEVISQELDYFLTGSTSFQQKLDISEFAIYTANTINLIDTKYDKTGGTISGNVLVLGHITGVTYSGIGGYTTLGTPPDGSYDNGLLGLNTGTTINDAVDQIDEILALLAPAKPIRLDISTYIKPSFTTAIASRNWSTISGSTITNVIMANNQPLFMVTGSSSGTFSGFWNGLSGSLSFSVDGSLNGYKDLTSTTVNSSTGNTGTYSGLTINVNDYYINQPGKSGFWSAVSATGRTTNQLSYDSYTAHTYNLTHSDTGSLSTSFYIDNPITPAVTTPTVSSYPTITRYVSGVPSLATGDIFNLTYVVSNAVSKFYRSGTFGLLTTNSVTNGTWGSTSAFAGSSITPIPLSGDSVTLTNQTITSTNNRYGETLTTYATGYNARNISANSSTLTITGYRIDTVSNETIRLGSGSSQPYPTDYGYIYVSNTSLLSGNYTNELQLLNGIYRYPTTNYTSYGGPNYSTISNNRYVTLNVGSITNASNFTLNLVGTGFSTVSNQITTGIYLHVSISGSTGWLDGNLPYSSGIPINDGDASMDVGNSTQTSTTISRRITLGSTTRTGVVYVKFGLPVGSTITLTSITKV